jgi:hypothetical protein
VKLIQVGLKKRLCRGGLIKASLHEQARDERRNFDFALKPANRFCVNT